MTTSFETVDVLREHNQRLKAAYEKDRLRKRLFVILLVPVVGALVGSAVAFGSADISFWDTYGVVFRRVFQGDGVDALGNAGIIVWRLRLPRVILGLVAGVALGSSGAVMQVVLRNPLADPYMLGISSAASFGASLAIVMGVGVLGGSYLVIGNAFLFSLLSAGLILMLSSRNGTSPEKMLLTGLALLFFFQAMTTITQYFGDSDAVRAAVFWAVGDLGRANWTTVAISAGVVAVGTGLLVWKSGDLNVMNTGDESAQSMGINVSRTRVFTMVVCTVMVACIVSFTGTIGFVGLVAPHLVRMIVGPDNRILVPASGLIGAVLLVLADTVARTVVSPVILPVGAVTAFLGVPLFVYLIMRRKGGLA